MHLGSGLRVRSVAAALVLVLIATVSACGGGSTKKQAAPPKPPPPTADTTGTTAGPSRSQSYDDLLQLSIIDIQDYWKTQMPEVFGAGYTKIADDLLIAATPDNPPPPCGQEMTYADVEGNAFYCFPGQYVTWDNAQLFPDLHDEFGTFTIALVLAHEWGHVVQGQVGITGPSIYMELQADCFAGAWTSNVAEGKSPNLELEPSAFGQALGGMLKFRDQPGTPSDDEQAHGSGFDRVNAFQEGFENGPSHCASYIASPPAVLETPFSSEEEYDSGGNMSYEEVVQAAALDLNDYWTGLDATFVPIDALQPYDSAASELPSCGGREYARDEVVSKVFYCEKDNYVGYDEALAIDVVDQIGDFGLATLLSFQWGVAAQQQAGLSKESDDTFAQRACFTGSWTGSILTGRTDNFALSPGDLDEVVLTFLAFGAPTDDDAVGSAFALTKAMRGGLFSGEETCAAYTGGT